MDIPLPTQDDIYQYGFDKNLNRNTEDVSLINNTEKVVEDVLAKAGINLDTTSSTSSGGSGGFERKDYHWFTVFESIDNYVLGGSNVPTATNTGVHLTTGATSGNTSELTKTLVNYNNILSWDKNRKIKCKVALTITGNQNLVFFISTGTASTTTNNTNRHFGFYIQGGTLLFGTVADGTTQSILGLKTGLLQGDELLLEARLIAGKKVEFYVDGSFAGTITQNIPTGNVNPHILLDCIARTSEGVAKTLDLIMWDFWQAN